MIDSQFLLTDEQMRQFITEGYVILKTDFSKEFHKNLFQQLKKVYETEGNPGNNLLPRIPDLQKVFDHPAIKGALTSALGPDYMMHPHRHGHYNNQSQAGGWHKDNYWGYFKTRNHFPWWAMIFYYPQDVTLEMGPTGIMPGTQCYETRTFEADETEEEIKAIGEAGTFVLVHYDIWHRANANTSGKDRYMLKFQFVRTKAPEAPSWNNLHSEWVAPAAFTSPIFQHDVLWQETWNWLRGERAPVRDQSTVEDVNSLSKALHDKFEPVALNAAYELAQTGDEGINSLLHALQSNSTKVSRVAGYGLSIAGSAALNGLIEMLHSDNKKAVAHAAFALGELGEVAANAVPALVKLMDHESEFVRRNTVEALGTIGVATPELLVGLQRGLKDEDEQVRFMTGLSFTRLGTKAAESVPSIVEALDDENRYVRANAADALFHIGTEQAKEALLNFLRSSRWCSTTTAQSTF